MVGMESATRHDISIRHTLATLAYRLGKVLRDTPPEFGTFQIHESSRTPGQILTHIGDLMDWALTQVEGRTKFHESAPLPWEHEIARFFTAIEELDRRIAAGGWGKAGGAVSAEVLFQGAIADALTHTGQIALLRRIAGIPVRGESYAVAEIVAGRVGREQAAPRFEFD
jgi:hypothetical protein